MPDILNCNDSPTGQRLTEHECAEIANALYARIEELKRVLALPDVTYEKLNDGITPRMRASFQESLERCERLTEVFE
jgi:hypothetical protein